MVFFDFGPGERIAQKVDTDRIEIRRTPFKGRMTHVLERKDDAALVYSEQVKRKPERLRIDMHRGANAEGCLVRVKEG